MAKKLTAQQKAERGRARMRSIKGLNALDKSIVLGTKIKGKKKTLPENR